MSNSKRKLYYNDFLLIIIVVLIGASLLLTALLTLKMQQDREFSELERISYRNRLVQLGLENGLQRAYQTLYLEGVEELHRIEPNKIAEILQSINEENTSIPGIEWILIDAVDDEYFSLSDHPVDSYTSTLSGDGEIRRRRDTPFVTLYRSSSKVDPAICVVFAPHDQTDGVRKRYRWALTVPISSLLPYFEPVSSEHITVTVLDWNGNRIVGADINSSGFSNIATDWNGTGFSPAAARDPYLGIMNLDLWKTYAPSIRQEARSVHSLIPISTAGIYLVLEDPIISSESVENRSIAVIVAVGTILYALIIVLFVSFRRMVVAQTKSLSELSDHKNVLFSLVSHNLKNNLAAIAAEATYRPDNERLIAPVTDASRVVSNSLYYLQFQEGNFPEPPREAVDLRDLVDFLTARCNQEALAKRQAFRVVNSEEVRWVSTNLDLALDALERILINSIQHSSEDTSISIESGTGDNGHWIAIADHGPGFQSSATEVFESPPLRHNGRFSQDSSLRGIGLPVAREILHSLHAEMKLDFTGPNGSRVIVTFPHVGDISKTPG